MCPLLLSCIDCIQSLKACKYFVPIVGESFCSEGQNVTGEFNIILGDGDSQFCPAPTASPEIPEKSGFKLDVIGKYNSLIRYY